MNKARLIIITGLPGTGKSTVAQALARRLSAQHLNSDIIRQEAELRGQYDDKTKNMIYATLFERVDQFLENGVTVIVDATFYKQQLRRPIYELAAKHKIEPVWIVLSADEDEIKKRTNKKRAYSEADYNVYLKIKEEYEPLEMSHFTVRTDICQLDNVIDKIQNYIISQKHDGAE